MFKQRQTKVWWVISTTFVLIFILKKSETETNKDKQTKQIPVDKLMTLLTCAVQCKHYSTDVTLNLSDSDRAPPDSIPGIVPLDCMWSPSQISVFSPGIRYLLTVKPQEQLEQQKVPTTEIFDKLS